MNLFDAEMDKFVKDPKAYEHLKVRSKPKAEGYNDDPAEKARTLAQLLNSKYGTRSRSSPADIDQEINATDDVVFAQAISDAMRAGMITNEEGRRAVMDNHYIEDIHTHPSATGPTGPPNHSITGAPITSGSINHDHTGIDTDDH